MDDHITAGNSVAKVTDTLLRNDLILVEEIGFAPLDDTGTQLLFRFIAAACERRALGRHRYLRGIKARLLPDSRNRKRSPVAQSQVTAMISVPSAAPGSIAHSAGGIRGALPGYIITGYTIEKRS